MDAEAYLHIVMDAYHGDVVSVPGSIEVIDGDPPGADGDGGGSAARITVRVASGAAVPELPEAVGWYVRFVGRGKALDARTSDGTLESLCWDEDGFTATLDAGDARDAFGAGRRAAAKRVMHVLVVPEARSGR